MEADKYYSSHLVEYESPDSIGFLSVDVLPFLIGKAWNDRALDWVHSLRPSCIRVVRYNEAEKCDARNWRVTVRLDAGGKIESIEQEVEVGCRTADNGGDLREQLEAAHEKQG